MPTYSSGVINLIPSMSLSFCSIRASIWSSCARKCDALASIALMRASVAVFSARTAAGALSEFTMKRSGSMASIDEIREMLGRRPLPARGRELELRSGNRAFEFKASSELVAVASGCEEGP